MIQQSRRARAVAAARTTIERTTTRANEWVERQRQARPLMDLAHRFLTRDAEAAGGVLGSAVAFRVFLFFVPLVLFLVGVLGVLSAAISSSDANEAVGVRGQMATLIQQGVDQSATGRWVALVTGLVGTLWTGRSLTVVLVVVSARAWKQPPARLRAAPRVVAVVMGLLVATVIVAGVLNRIRLAGGIGLATTGTLAIGILYGVGWFLVLLSLPRETRDPTALLPGAAVVGATMGLAQWFLQLYLPERIDRASELYGSLGVSLAALGVFFLLGRMLVASMVLNAVVWERFGSIGEKVAQLPGIRHLLWRLPRLARFFGVEHVVAPKDDPSSQT